MPQTLTHNCRTVAGALRVVLDRKVDAYKTDMDVHQTRTFLPPHGGKSVDKFMSLFCFFANFCSAD